MKRLFVIAVAWTLATAKPEVYKEKEDFQFSRSSTDEGSKSGYYGAQRGNMGGNYERAHNMDSLAQRQMSGAVNQIQGELGESLHERTGSVYTAANSRGIYGSGNYDLSNLQGRNFEEGSRLHGSSYDSTHQSLSRGGYNAGHSATAHNSEYSSQSENSAYNSAFQRQAHSGSLHTNANDLQSVDHLYDRSYDYGREATNADSMYYMQAGQRAQSNYGGSDLHSAINYGTNAQTRIVAGEPAKVVLRPGTRIIIPIAAQTYDASRLSSQYHNGIANSDAESFTNSAHRGNALNNNAKNYESSYSYRKEWEKHDTQPVVGSIPTVPINSELYEDAQVASVGNHQYDAQEVGSQSSHTNHAYSNYNAHTKSASTSQSRYQTDNIGAIGAQQHGTTHGLSSDLHTNADLSSGGTSNTGDIQTSSDTRPKSYHSSYSYHKSWERQGDPYVILPSSNGLYEGQASQKLTSGLSNQASHSSNQYGSQYNQGSVVECDPNGHVRVARSASRGFSNSNNEVNPYPYSYRRQSGWENYDLGQQPVNQWDQTEELGQQTQDYNQFQNLEQHPQNSESLVDFGQQIQIKERIEDLAQHPQSSDSLMDFGQQTQTQLEDLSQHPQNSDNLFKFGQQIQTNERLEDLGQHPQNSDSLIDFGQQTQTQLEDLAQHSQNSDSLVDFGQQMQTNEHLEDLSQHPQSSDSLVDFGQQTQTQLEDLSQHPQNSDNLFKFGQQIQTNERLKDLGQHPQSSDSLIDFGQQTQIQLEELGQHPQDSDSLVDFGQQMQTNEHLEDLGQHPQSSDSLVDFGQQTQTQLEDLSQHPQNSHSLVNIGQQIQTNERLEDMGQHPQSSDSLVDFGQQTQTQVQNLDQHRPNSDSLMDFSQQTQTNENMKDFEGQRLNSDNANNAGQQTQNNWKDFGQQVQSENYNPMELVQNTWNHFAHIGQKDQNTNQFHFQKENQGYQQSQDLDVVGHNYNINHDFNNEQVKPVWEPAEDTQTPVANSNANTQSHGLQDLWGKIDSLESQLTINNNNFGTNDYSNIHSQSNTNSYSENWAHEHHYNAASFQNSYHHSYSSNNNENTANNEYNHNNNEKQSSTTTATYDERNDIKKKRPSDVVRGDIGNEEEIPMEVESAQDQENNILLVNKPNKTTEEIQTLSLTQSNHRRNFNDTQSNSVQTNNENTENGFGVISIQQWLEQERQLQRGLKSNETERRPTLSTSTHSTDIQKQMTEHLFDEVQQSSKDNHFYGQTGDSLYQQSTINDNLDQQVQTVWEPKDLQQQAETQFEMESFGNINSQGNDFYQQELDSRRIHNGQLHEERSPQFPYRHVEPQVTVTTTSSVSDTTTTQKPGFWNSVSNKFTNAKDKVVSWFKS